MSFSALIPVSDMAAANAALFAKNVNYGPEPGQHLRPLVGAGSPSKRVDAMTEMTKCTRAEFEQAIDRPGLIADVLKLCMPERLQYLEKGGMWPEAVVADCAIYPDGTKDGFRIRGSV